MNKTSIAQFIIGLAGGLIVYGWLIALVLGILLAMHGDFCLQQPGECR